MDFKFLAALVLIIVTAVSVFVWRHYRGKLAALTARITARRSDDSRRYDEYDSRLDRNDLGDATLGVRVSLGASIAFGVLALIMSVCSVFTIVPTKEVGVVTSFGSPVGYLSNGLSAVRPWARVTPISATIQTDNHVDEGDKKGAINVRLGNNSTARANVTVVWRIQESAAPQLFQDYNGSDPLENVRDNLVTRELGAALNSVLSDFNPLAVTTENGPDGKSVQKVGAGASNGQLAEKVRDILRSKVGDRVEIIGVNMPTISFDGKTQETINNLQTAINETLIAEQRGKTAAAEKAANDTLASSVQNDNVLRSKCLDIAREKNQPILGCMSLGGGGVIVSPK